MPTRPGFDLVPVRKETKERLAELKGQRTYDDVLRTLLEAAPAPTPQGTGKTRSVEEQLALADLAARRWRAAVADGRIAELGPRLFLYHTRQPPPRRTLRAEWPARRGLAP